MRREKESRRDPISVEINEKEERIPEGFNIGRNK
jgi:hypothetical protein